MTSQTGANVDLDQIINEHEELFETEEAFQNCF